MFLEQRNIRLGHGCRSAQRVGFFSTILSDLFDPEEKYSFSKICREEPA